jgi:hypothetical protein
VCWRKRYLDPRWTKQEEAAEYWIKTSLNICTTPFPGRTGKTLNHNSVPGQEVFLFSQDLTPDLGSNHPPVQSALASLSREVQRLRRKADHSPHLVPKVTASTAMLPLSPVFDDMNRNNFTCYLLFLVCRFCFRCFLILYSSVGVTVTDL